MKRTILYGIGEYYKQHKSFLPDDIKVIAYGDSNKEKSTLYTGQLLDGKPVLVPAEIVNTEFDYLFICTDFPTSHAIYQHLQKFDIPGSKIKFLNRLHTVKAGWEYIIEDDYSIISSIGKIKIREKKRTDFDIVSEIFVHNCYDINTLDETVIVIDMGMNIGGATLFYAQKDNVEKVYGFEPFPDTYQQAIDNFLLNKEEIRNKIHPFCVAASNWEGSREIAVNVEESGWRNIFSCDKEKQRVTIYSRRASDIVEEIVRENPGKRILLKVDTEGSEFDIFDSIGKTSLLEKIDAIAMEYHRDPEVILDLLKRNYFKYVMSGKIDFGMIYAFRMDRKS